MQSRISHPALSSGALLKTRLRKLTKLIKLAVLISMLGPRRAALFCAQVVRLKLTRDTRIVNFSTQHAAYPLGCRANTSDLKVFRQIFIAREYSCLDDLKDVRLILDCGANVGYSSAYFLSRFPHAEMIAIEPDVGNFELLSRNLRPYRDRVKTLRSAVWSHSANLVVAESSYRDGREWSRQVKDPESDEDGDVPAVGIGALLRESDHEKISILKVDIEGSEAVVFSENYESWLEHVDNIAIELHDDTMFGDCTAIFERAIAGRGFNMSRSGELTVCKTDRD